MEKEYVYFKWRKFILISALIIAIVQLTAELGIFFVFYFNDWLDVDVTYYVILHILLPTIVNSISVFGGQTVIKFLKTQEDKNTVAVLVLTIPCLLIGYFHSIFPVVIVTVVVPMILCCIFENRKLLYYIFISAIIMGGGPFLMNYYIEKQELGQISMSLIAVYAIIISSFVCLCATMKCEEEKLSMAIAERDKAISLYEQLKFDPSTNLYNRVAMGVYIEEAIEKKLSPICIMIDIDDFKHFNDQMGHLAGDEVIKIVSGELKRVAKDENIKAGRYGGDEFVLLVTNTNIDKTKETIKEVIKNIQSNGKYDIGLSIGLSNPNKEFKTVEEIVESADNALYVVKEKGKNSFEVDLGE